MIGMTVAVVLALGSGLLLGWVLFRIELPPTTVEVDVSVDFLGLFAELQIYREAKAMVAVGTEARVLDKDIGAAQLDAAKARLADQLERALATLGLDPLSLPYPKYQALVAETAEWAASLQAEREQTLQRKREVDAAAVARWYGEVHYQEDGENYPRCWVYGHPEPPSHGTIVTDKWAEVTCPACRAAPHRA